MERPKNRLPEMIFILVLLVITTYLTAAYFVKFWPFKPEAGPGSKVIDLKNIASDAKKTETKPTDRDLTKGVVGDNEGTYDLSDGKPYDCGAYIMAFPEGWIRITKNNGANVTGTDPNDATNTVIVSQIEGLVADESSRVQTVEGIVSSLGSGYKIGESQIMEFLDRKCLLVSGTAPWNGITAGLLILAVPDGKGPDFLVVGMYNPDKPDNKTIVTGAMVSLTPKTLR